MPEFNIRTDAVDVEQIMRQIRARIREKRGVDYTEAQIQELANVKLETFLDPKGVRSDLVEQFRRTRGTSPPPPNYAFEDTTLFDSHRWIVRVTRRLLRPLLKLFLNPNTLVHVLHEQSAINDLYAKRFDARDELDALYYEVVHNLVLETTRLGIEVKNLKMRVESTSSRLDFDERRARALEGVVQFRPGAAVSRERVREQPPAATALAGTPADAGGGTATEEGPSGPPAAHRRRRRRRGRRGRGNTPAAEGSAALPASDVPGSAAPAATEFTDVAPSAEPDDDGSDEGPLPSDQ
jgi:hypothetical protein